MSDLRNRIALLLANTALLSLILTMPVPKSQAASPGKKAKSAASLGLLVNVVDDRVVVAGSTTQALPLGLRVGDRIVAVNGRRVSSEAAFMNRLATAPRGKQAPSIVIVRNNKTQTLSTSGGWMSPSQMVLTSQGAMHKDAAARLGLPGTPIEGTEEPLPSVHR
jgi:S1-C subfamily serine protease